MKTDAPTATGTAEALPDRTLLAAFLEYAPDIVFFKDRESRFIAVSRSKATRHGAEPAELIGRTDADYFSEEHAQAARADEERIMATGTPVLGRVERTRFIDGREGWTEVTKLPLRDETGAVIGTFGLSTDVTEAQRMKLELEQAQRNLVEASRTAGMAEVATGVLHNVGNVLTSLNVSANVIAGSLHQSKAGSLEKLSGLLHAHAADLGAFIADDPKGRRVPEFIETLAQHWREESDRLTAEITSLQEHIDHIKEIVTMQQSYATLVGAVESLDPAALMEDALRMNAGALARRAIVCVRQFQPVSRIVAEKARVLQILVNLIRNAQHAMEEHPSPEHLLTLRIGPGGEGHVRLEVQDNGMGIPPENLAKIFNHGFTTRADGHGFGLPSSVKAAEGMNARLTVQSDGIGKGATFALELPIAPDPAPRSPAG